MRSRDQRTYLFIESKESVYIEKKKQFKSHRIDLACQYDGFYVMCIHSIGGWKPHFTWADHLTFERELGDFVWKRIIFLAETVD